MNSNEYIRQDIWDLKYISTSDEEDNDSDIEDEDEDEDEEYDDEGEEEKVNFKNTGENVPQLFKSLKK